MPGGCLVAIAICTAKPPRRANMAVHSYSARHPNILRWRNSLPKAEKILDLLVFGLLRNVLDAHSGGHIVGAGGFSLSREGLVGVRFRL